MHIGALPRAFSLECTVGLDVQTREGARRANQPAQADSTAPLRALTKKREASRVAVLQQLTDSLCHCCCADRFNGPDQIRPHRSSPICSNMTTPQAAEKERAKALVRDQRERERLEKEKERLARVEKMQRAQSSAAASSGASRPSRSSAERDDDPDADSDNETAEEAAANKKEYQQKIVQLWKEKAKKPPRIGGSENTWKTAEHTCSRAQSPRLTRCLLVRSPRSLSLCSPIRFKTVLRNTILDVFRGDKASGNFGWTESHSETDWDIFWTNKEWIRMIYDKIHLDHTQKVNHFRNFYELTRKDLLVKNLKRSKRSLMAKKGRESEGEEYDFFPDTFCLSEDCRVLTDRGFLFLHELEQADETVNYACFNPATSQLEYHPGVALDALDPACDLKHPGLIVKPHAAYDMVEFTHGPEAKRWTPQAIGSASEGRPVSVEEAEDDAAQSNHVSLLVSPEHDMYVQLGNTSQDNHQNDVACAQTGADAPVPFRKLPAATLLSDCTCPPNMACAHRMQCARFLAVAVEGVKVASKSPELAAVMHRLGLPADKLESFLDLYGQ